MHHREVGCEQRERPVLSNCFRQPDAVKKLLLGALNLVEKEMTVAGIKMNPRTPLARMQSICDLDFALRVFQTVFVVAGVNAVFTEILVTGGLREQSVVFLSKRYRAPRPSPARAKRSRISRSRPNELSARRIHRPFLSAGIK